MVVSLNAIETPTSTAATGAGPVSGVDQTIRGVEGMQTQAGVIAVGVFQ